MSEAGYARMPGQSFTRKLKTGVSVQEPCMVMKVNSDGTVEQATNTDQPYAATLNTTRHETKYNLVGDESFKTGGVIQLTRGGQVRLAVAMNNSAIAIGDELAVSATADQKGRVDKSARDTTMTSADDIKAELNRIRRVVAIAEEAVPAGGAVDARGAESVLASLRFEFGVGP